MQVDKPRAAAGETTRGSAIRAEGLTRSFGAVTAVERLTFSVATQDLMAALETLQALGEESVGFVPQLVEPWRVYVSDEAVGKSVAITVDAKLTFGEAARLKPELAALIYNRLHANGVALAD